MLLDALLEEQLAAPDELQEDRDLPRMREDLERIALQVAHHDDDVDFDEMRRDLATTSDAQLQVLLEVGGDWIDMGDGVWRVRDMLPNASGVAGAKFLKELRRLSSAPVAAVRDLEYLVQLLRDPAYASVRRRLPTARAPRPRATARRCTRRRLRRGGGGDAPRRARSGASGSGQGAATRGQGSSRAAARRRAVERSRRRSECRGRGLRLRLLRCAAAAASHGWDVPYVQRIYDGMHV